MGRLKLFLLSVFIAVLNIAGAQNFDTAWHPVLTSIIPGNYSDFYVDNLNNVYLINNKSIVKKINENGDSIAVFNTVRKFGNAFTLDVTNPLKILLFYKDFATILTLDRFLNAVHTTDLRKYDIQQASAVALSYDNNFWVFDELNNKLKKIDDNGNLLLETPDFRTIFSEPFHPTQIIDNSGLLYLYDPGNGWRIFDYYGAFKYFLPEKNWRNVHAENKFVTGHDSGNIYRANVDNFTTKFYRIPDSVYATKVFWQMNKLYLLNKDGLAIFAVQ